LPAKICAWSTATAVQEVNTHDEAAQWVYLGKADVTLGLQSAAHRYQLDFIPLFEEKFDLIMELPTAEGMTRLAETLNERTFRQKLSQLPGYNPTQTGMSIVLPNG
jgi:putative molybdopterin biosynthesis protein